MNREGGNKEHMRKWREIHSLHILIFSLSPRLSMPFKICHILLKNVKYGTCVANVTKNLTYALWENNSGSNSLRESSASCASLMMVMVMVMNIRRSPVQPYVPQYVATVTQHFKWHPRQIKSFHINHPHRPKTCAWPVLQHKKCFISVKMGKKGLFLEK